MASGDALAATQVPQTELGLADRPLPPGVAADRRHGDALQAGKVATTRYRYRGAKIATPWEAGWIARRDPICGPERLENLVA